MKLPPKEKVKKLFSYFQKTNYEHVIRESRSLLKKFPDSAALHNLIGLALQQKNNLQDSKISYLNALKLEPENPAILNNLGSIYRILEDYKNSEKYLLKVLNMNPNYINALSNYGNLKRETNNFNEAIEFYIRALKIDNNQFIVHHNLALAYQGIGEFELSKKHAKIVLELNPEHSLSHKMLSTSTKYTKDNNHFKLMKNKLDENKLDQKQKIDLNFSISKAYEDFNDFKNSFFHLELGNNIKRKMVNYSIEKDKYLFQTIKNNFNKYSINLANNKKEINKKIIFICGMPRSGTTLIEQIIASHTKVYGAGELNYLSKTIRKNFFKGENFLEEIFSNKIGNNDNNILNEYFEYLNYHSFKEKIITDKAPLNFRWIGFIKIFFPNSKIIHCSRDKKDNCLSLYKNSFDSDNLNWCYDQGELASYYNLYNDLMKFWKEKLPGFIYDAKYENIVQNQEAETKKILEFCNLEWESGCLNFYKNKKTPIKTASIHQARKPIYKSSLKLSDKYSSFLDNLFKSLT